MIIKCRVLAFLTLCFILVSCLAYPFILKMNAMYIPSNGNLLYGKTQQPIPIDGTLHNYCYENFKAYINIP
jgi:hypothetical protein